MPACECFLGQVGRVLMFSLLGGGCACAFLAATSCEFFSYTDSLEAASLPPPFTNQTDGRVGIFGSIMEEETEDVCVTYSDNLMDAIGTLNTYWITAQFCAIVGPSAAAVAWILNLVEWFFWSHTCTYTLVVVLLLVAFSAQGLTFMIYGQREFCFDDQVAGDCQLELGAYLAIAATAAFYAAAIVWCCMPRNPPFCTGPPPPKANKGEEDDDDEFYGAHTRAMLQEDEDADYNNYTNAAPKELEPSSVYDDSGASENVGWADSNNRGGIPQRSADDSDYYTTNPNPPPMAPIVESPPAEWDAPPSHDRSIDWIANNGDLLASSSQDPSGDDFDNPFLLDDSNLPPEDPAHRPAYGNLQG